MRAFTIAPCKCFAYWLVSNRRRRRRLLLRVWQLGGWGDTTVWLRWWSPIPKSYLFGNEFPRSSPSFEYFSKILREHFGGSWTAIPARFYSGSGRGVVGSHRRPPGKERQRKPTPQHQPSAPQSPWDRDSAPAFPVSTNHHHHHHHDHHRRGGSRASARGSSVVRGRFRGSVLKGQK